MLSDKGEAADNSNAVKKVAFTLVVDLVKIDIANIRRRCPRHRIILANNVYEVDSTVEIRNQKCHKIT